MSHYRCVGECCTGESEGQFWLPRRRFLKAGFSSLIGGAAAAASAPAMAAPAGAVYQDFWFKPRALSLYRKQTGERAVIEYWRNGGLVLDGWYQLLHMLRDVNAGVAMHYDPEVVNVVWGTQEWARLDTGKLHVFRLTDGARTEQTNRNTPGAAELSEHKKGRAIDGSFEGLSLSTYAGAARFFNKGGVGLYARHVHVDSGTSRMWRG